MNVMLYYLKEKNADGNSWEKAFYRKLLCNVLWCDHTHNLLNNNSDILHFVYIYNILIVKI